VGGLEMQAQARALAARPHVVVATPGRLRGLLAADASLAAGFARARFLVLDEADRLLVRRGGGLRGRSREPVLAACPVMGLDRLTRGPGQQRATSLREGNLCVVM
jgi:hypothetical protein